MRYCVTNYAVIPGRRQVGFTDLLTSPETITPAGSCSLAVRNRSVCGYGFRAPLATLAAPE